MKLLATACAAVLIALLCSWSLLHQGGEAATAPAQARLSPSYGDFLRTWENKKVSISPPRDGSYWYVSLDDNGIDLILSVGSDFVQVSRRGTRYALPLAGVVFRGW